SFQADRHRRAKVYLKRLSHRAAFNTWDRLPPPVNRESASVAPFPALRWISQSALVALAVVLPFELVKPVAPLGPLQLSSVEVFLYLTVGSWLGSWLGSRLARRVAGGRAAAGTVRRRGPLAIWRELPEVHRAAALWSLALLLAAALAPVARGSAVKFALR